jgi:glycogen(starch) synthase
MALGKPLVASRTGGIPELVEHGVSGWLVAPGDADDLALALRTLLSDASLRAQLSLGARARSARFSVGGMVAAYEALYLRCMEM